VPTKFPSLDGTPLAGTMAVLGDASRPGIVLAPGLSQTMDLKFVVELATLFLGNGWHVLAMDFRDHGESRRLSPALISRGWKEAGDVLGAVEHLQKSSQATSVAVIGFSMSGRSLIKAMAQDDRRRITAGIAVSPNVAPSPPITPPPAGYVPGPRERFFLDFLRAPSFHEYYQRAARSYGVDLPTLEAKGPADTAIADVKAPLLVLHALDDFFALGEIRQGRHDGGTFSLAFRDRVRDHPHVRTLLVDRGGHAGTLYLSDPHWFGLATLSYLKHWQARPHGHVTVAVPPLDVLAEGVPGDAGVSYRHARAQPRPRSAGSRRGPPGPPAGSPAQPLLARCGGRGPVRAGGEPPDVDPASALGAEDHRRPIRRRRGHLGPPLGPVHGDGLGRASRRPRARGHAGKAVTGTCRERRK
jgi:esterase/lipase